MSTTVTAPLPRGVVEDPDHVLVRSLTKTYPGFTHAPPALDDIDLVIPRGTFVSLIGPSGCGKSTLLRSVAGIERFDAGTISIFGHSPAEACAAKAVGLVPQTPALLPWLTVLQNVALPHRVNRRAERHAAHRGLPGSPGPVDPTALVEMVGLTGHLHQYPGELSGGMQQRVSIARAFGLRPQILLMDEPFSALDEFTREALRLQLLRLWQRMQVTVLFVTHSVREAVALSDQVVVMAGRPGRVHEVIDVDLPRPRDEGVLASTHLLEVEDRVRTSLETSWRAGGPRPDTGAA